MSPPRATLLGWIVAAKDTLPVPSKLIWEATTSPVNSNVLAVANDVAVSALPVKFPVNVVAVIAPETLTSSSSVWPSTSKSPLTSIAPAKVETPLILTSSSSVWPSTSKSPLASMAPVNVDRPDTLRLSNSVWPSTSKSPLASIAPVNVDRPDTSRLSTWKVPPPPDPIVILPTVRIPLTRTSPRTSNSALGSKIVVPIPTWPTTSNTFWFSVLPSIPIFCCWFLPLRNLIGAAIFLL